MWIFWLLWLYNGGAPRMFQMAGSDDLVAVSWGDGRAPVRVLEQVVAASDSDDFETESLELRNQLPAVDSREASDSPTVSVWTPTKSKGSAGSPAVSKNSSIASRVRTLDSSRGFAWGWHPDRAGTEAT